VSTFSAPPGSSNLEVIREAFSEGLLDYFRVADDPTALVTFGQST
jgi:hypothetical protein